MVLTLIEKDGIFRFNWFSLSNFFFFSIEERRQYGNKLLNKELKTWKRRIIEGNERENLSCN